jgi:uncharacterized membrane protein YuzA (DUF378 family)
MVSDAMLKVFFLPVPVPYPFVPRRKSNLQLFFRVKHVFPTIKWWPTETGLIKSERTIPRMKKVDAVAAALVMIGALNWGLAGVFHLDLVATVFGMRFGETSALSSVVYALVGLSGLYQALTWKSIQRRWQNDGVLARA